jgi:hypothetical protein
MPFALITIGLIFFLSALNTVNGQPAYKALSTQLYSDIFTSSPSFLVWALALVAVGALGYIPGFKKPADWFMVLIILTMILANGGFFQQLEAAINAGPAGTGTGTPLPNTANSSAIASTAGAASVAGLNALVAGNGVDPSLTGPPTVAGLNALVGTSLSDPIGSGVTGSQFSEFLANNGIVQEQPITVELPGIGVTQTGTANFTIQ